MKSWLLLFAFIGCVAVAQEDDGTEPFDSGVDDWGFEESAQPKPGGVPPAAETSPNPGNMPPPPNLPRNDDSGSGMFTGGGGGGSNSKSGAVRFHTTGTKKSPAQKKNWPEIKKSLMK